MRRCVGARCADARSGPHPPGTACPRARAPQVDETRTAGRGVHRGGAARATRGRFSCSGRSSRGGMCTGSTARWRSSMRSSRTSGSRSMTKGRGSLGEIFIDRIEPGDARERPVPEGYGENGIWVRGAHDYAQPRVAGAIGTGRSSTMSTWIGEATWVERRIVLVDAVRQVEEVRAESGWLLDHEGRWRDVDEEECFRYVDWIGARAQRATQRRRFGCVFGAGTRSSSRPRSANAWFSARRDCAATTHAPRPERSTAGAEPVRSPETSRSQCERSGSRRASRDRWRRGRRAGRCGQRRSDESTRPARLRIRHVRSYPVDHRGVHPRNRRATGAREYF